MKIAATQYSPQYGSLEVYISGCDGACPGCHNPELWNYDLGLDYRERIPYIIEKTHAFESMIDRIWILGGEPLLQDTDCLVDLLSQLRVTGKTIFLFTRFPLAQIPEEVREYCDIVKCGEYDASLDQKICDKVTLASSNQTFYQKRGRSDWIELEGLSL